MGYQSSEDKAKENHSSGYMLIIIGAVCFAVDVFVFSFNPMDTPLFNLYLSCGVMGALFILFIVMGAVSLKDSKKLHEKASSENTLKEALEAWCREKLDAESIDAACREKLDAEPIDAACREKLDAESIDAACRNEAETEAGEGSQDLYYVRTDYIKDMISKKFMNLDDDLLEDFVDSYYAEIFDKEKNDAEVSDAEVSDAEVSDAEVSDAEVNDKEV